MKLTVGQIRKIIKEEVSQIAALPAPKSKSKRGTFRGRRFDALSPEDKAHYEERAKMAGADGSRSFAGKSLRTGTTWVTKKPFVATDDSLIYDTDLLSFKPAHEVGHVMNKVVRNFPVGTTFTVLDDNFGLEWNPHSGEHGGLPLSSNEILVDVGGEEFILMFVRRSDVEQVD